jgi:hypothetical protein
MLKVLLSRPSKTRNGTTLHASVIESDRPIPGAKSAKARRVSMEQLIAENERRKALQETAVTESE